MSRAPSQGLSLRRFCLIGMTVASLEEFISQGVLKRSVVGWIIPTIIAFLPFLVGTAIIHGLLQRRLWNGNRLELSFYTVSGGIGLMVEWFLVGLSPWNSFGADPLVSTVFQLAMFSFWGSVAFVPRILQDKRLTVAGLVKQLKRSLIAGFAIIYFLTFLVGRQAQFIAGIV